MSETKMIYQKIIDVFNDIEAVGKNQKNDKQGWKFRGIDDMYNAIHPLFKKHNIFITTEVLSSKREERKSSSGGLLLWTFLDVKFFFYTSDGSYITSTMVGEANDSGDKSANKAMSAALKYAIMQTFLIPTEDLVDADKTTHEIETTVETKPKSAADKIKNEFTSDGMKEIEKSIESFDDISLLEIYADELREQVKTGKLRVSKEQMTAIKIKLEEQKNFINRSENNE